MSPVIHWSEKPYDDRFTNYEPDGWDVSVEPTNTSYGSKSAEHPVFRYAMKMLSGYVGVVTNMISQGRYDASENELEEYPEKYGEEGYRKTIGTIIANEYHEIWENYSTSEWWGEGDSDFVKELLWSYLWDRFFLRVIYELEELFPKEHREKRKELGLIDDINDDAPSWGW